MKNFNDRLLADRSCGRWRQGVLCVIQSLPHPDFGCVTRFAEWFCVRPSFLFSPSPLSPSPVGRRDTQANIKRKWEARSIRRKQEVSSQNGRVGISLEFPCKFFFSWNQSAPDMFFWNLKSQMICPLLPLFTCLCNQIDKWLKKPGRRAYSVSRATKDLSSEPWCKSQWKTGFYILV